MLRVEGLAKRYGRTAALAGLSVAVPRGSILGIAGPNGAGKSTLIKILAGDEGADEGEITLDGQPLDRQLRADIGVVHQDPGGFPNLTVLENLLVGREGRSVRRPAASAEMREILADLDLEHVADQPLGNLPLGIQQRTAIASAVSRRASVFLFDEPNSALTHDESEQMFVWMHRLAKHGACVIFVSHRLGELVEHSDEIVVIRDGRVVTQLGKATSAEDVARRLVADEGSDHLEARGTRMDAGEVLVRVDDWRSRRGAFRVRALTLHRGEIIAVVGVEGSGGREFVASLAGHEPVQGRLLTAVGTRADDLPGGSEYLPASRQDSLFDNLSLSENCAVRLGRGAIATRAGFLRRGTVRDLAEAARSEYHVVSESGYQPIRSLSGGNQQKVAIAAALASTPRIVAIEEPTRGVDVGSRVEIHRALRAFAARGSLVVVYCTEVSEAFELADRVFVMDHGELSSAVDVAGYTSAASFAAAIASLERHASGES